MVFNLKGGEMELLCASMNSVKRKYVCAFPFGAALFRLR